MKCTRTWISPCATTTLLPLTTHTWLETSSFLSPKWTCTLGCYKRAVAAWKVCALSELRFALVNVSFRWSLKSGISNGEKNALALTRTIFVLIVKSFLTHDPLWFLLLVESGGRDPWACSREAYLWLLQNCNENGSFPRKIYLT